MVERIQAPDACWAAVDEYIAAHLLDVDPALDAALAHSAARGLPDIAVAPVQGKLLQLLARIAGARRILEIGTLGGYSTIWLAGALPADGTLVTLEADPLHVEVAQENLARAGLDRHVTVIEGAALDSLAALEGPFDFTFIDADKVNNVDYVRAAIRLSRPGATIVVDNVVREGGLLDAASEDERIVGTRRLFEALMDEPRLSATAIQTVGVKKWDGFLIAVVNA